MDWLLNLLTAPWRWLKRFVRGFLAMSLAARIAWATALFLSFVVLLTLAALLLSGGSGWTTLQAWWSPGKGMLVIFLVCLVSVLVYYAARVWLQHDSGRFPDIDAAWDAALAEMARQQIDLRNSPLFLVLGCDGQEQERAIVGEAPVQFLVTSSPAGSAPVHVHAGHDGVFVCLSTIGQSCLLADALRSRLLQRRPAGAAAAVGPAGESSVPRGGLLPAQRSDAIDRLATLCELIRKQRSPLAAINGVLALVPFTPDDESLPFYTMMGQAICEDVVVVTRSFGLRAPLTVAFTDFDKLDGFPELLKQMPAAQRTMAVGQAFPPSRAVTADQLTMVGAATCARLTEQVAARLGRNESANQPLVNRKLISLMTRVRLTAHERVNAVLGNAAGFSAPGAGAPMLAGCFIMATDTMADRRAFVRGMFERMLGVQAELDWTPTQLSSDAWRRRTATLLKIVNVCLVLAFVGLIVRRVLVR